MTFRGLYVIQDVFEGDLNYQDYENRGVTDIIKAVQGTFNTNYNACKSIIDNTLTKLEGTSIKPHILVWSFHDAQNHMKYDDDQIDFLAGRSAQLIEDYPEVAGISFDDYYFYNSYHTEGEDEEEAQYLYDMAATVKSAMHDINPDAKLSAGLNPYEPNGGLLSVIGPGFDFIIPMCYRYYNGYPTFVRDIINDVKLKTNTPIAPGLLTFMNDSDVNLWGVEQLEDDMRTALGLCGGYALFIHPYVQSNLKFPTSPSRYKYHPTFGLIGKKPSPNFLFRNVADCGNSLNSTYGFGKYTNNETITLDTTKHVDGKSKSIKCEVTGQSQGIVPHPGSLTTKIDIPVVWSGKVYVPTGMNLSATINNGAHVNNTLIVGNDDWNDFEVLYTPIGSGGFNDWNYGVWTVIKFTTSNNPGSSSFNLGELQLEIGTEKTPWQPGK